MDKKEGNETGRESSEGSSRSPAVKYGQCSSIALGASAGQCRTHISKLSLLGPEGSRVGEVLIPWHCLL